MHNICVQVFSLHCLVDLLKVWGKVMAAGMVRQPSNYMHKHTFDAFGEAANIFVRTRCVLLCVCTAYLSMISCLNAKPIISTLQAEQHAFCKSSSHQFQEQNSKTSFCRLLLAL